MITGPVKSFALEMVRLPAPSFSIPVVPTILPAFSKKFENFQATVALNFAYYNFVKTHSANLWCDRQKMAAG